MKGNTAWYLISSSSLFMAPCLPKCDRGLPRIRTDRSNYNSSHAG